MELSHLLVWGFAAIAVGAVGFGIACLFLMKGKLRAHMALAVGVFLGSLLLWAGETGCWDGSGWPGGTVWSGPWRW